MSTAVMDDVLEWLGSAQDVGNHPAFPAFKRHIRYHLFDRVGTLDAWRWFKQGWEAREISS